MLRTFTAASILALVCAMPLHEAAAQDPIAGGILGGVAGGLLGGAIGGRGGARWTTGSNPLERSRRPKTLSSLGAC